MSVNYSNTKLFGKKNNNDEEDIQEIISENNNQNLDEVQSNNNDINKNSHYDDQLINIEEQNNLNQEQDQK